MSLSKSSIQKLRAVKAAILAEPELYDQSEIPWPGDSCSTPCCLAGWAIWLENPAAYKKTLRELGAYRGFMQSVGLTVHETDSLFMTASNWPMPFSEDYQTATTDKQRAKVAAARIDYFIETGGR